MFGWIAENSCGGTDAANPFEYTGFHKFRRGCDE